MKPYILLCLPVLLLLSACGGEGDFSIPDDLEEQLALLDEKRREMRAINAQIAELERAIGDEAGTVDTRLVRAEAVAAGTFEREVELQALVESDEVAIVTTELPGRVTAVYVDEGESVRAGQPLVKVDVETLNLQIADVENNLELARDLLERQERLREQNIGTELQYLEARNTVERLEKSLAQLRVQTGRSTITAPISGTVEALNVNAGEYASPGLPLMQILDASTVQVVADVPESYLRTVKEGQSVRVVFPSLDLTREAKVTDIGRTIDPANRTFRVELELSNRDRLLKPNMLASVYLVDYTRDDVIVTGSQVILEEVDGREFVYVARPVEGEQAVYRASKVYVETGETNAVSREILDGLEPGDLLVTQGMRMLTDGQLIRIEEKS